MPLGAARLNTLSKYFAPTGPTPDETQAVEFDQGDYVKLASPGFSDGKEFTLSIWFRAHTLPSLPVFITEIANSRYTQAGMHVYWNNSPTFQIRGRGSDNNYKLRAAYSDSSLITVNTWHHLACSFDLTSTSKRHIYWDGVDRTSDFSFNDYTNANFDFTRNEMTVGHSVTTSQISTDGFDGEIGDYYFDTNYLDLSTNISKFIDGSGNPVDLGSDGSTPSGSQPEVYLSGDTSTWGVNNFGSLGDFTTVGTLGDSANEPPAV